MGAVDTTYTFTATDTITSTKMNNIIDQTTITSDAVSGTTLEVVTGKLKVRSQGITSNEMAANSITSTQIVAGAVTTAKLASDAIIFNARTLANGGGQGGNPMTFLYSGQNGQPTWAWGTNDGTNHYVWNPANFYVAYATRAGNGPENDVFVQSHTANATKIYVAGFGNNKGVGIHCQRAANEASSALHFTKETGAVVGSIVLDTANSTNFNTTSDYRLKEDFVPVSDGLLKVNALKPTNFKWVDIDARMDGFIAHEVKEVVSNAVTGEKDAVDENNDPIYQQIDASRLIPIMVAAIQELSQKIAELESR